MNISQAHMDALNAGLKTTNPCPRCGQVGANLEGFAAIPITAQPTGNLVVGASVPVAVTSCGKCGLVEQYALGKVAPALLPGLGQAAAG